jgi:hypothetical protein
MAHALTLELDDETYAELAAVARNAGQEPDEVAVEAVVRLVHDPLADFIGAFTSDSPGWSDHHDELLAEAALDVHSVDR